MSRLLGLATLFRLSALIHLWRRGYLRLDGLSAGLHLATLLCIAARLLRRHGCNRRCRLWHCARRARRCRRRRRRDRLSTRFTFATLLDIAARVLRRCRLWYCARHSRHCRRAAVAGLPARFAGFARWRNTRRRCRRRRDLCRGNYVDDRRRHGCDRLQFLACHRIERFTRLRSQLLLLGFAGFNPTYLGLIFNSTYLLTWIGVENTAICCNSN